MPDASSRPITVVSVTYGHRWHLLRQALQAARNQGAAAAIVIDNGSLDAVGDLLAGEFGGWATHVRLDRNGGSAVGFATGIDAALQSGGERLLLLDDDNILAPQAFTLLTAALDELAAGPRIGAVFGLRAGHGEEQLLGELAGRRARVGGSVFEFHVADVPAKLLSRLRRTRRHEAGSPRTLPETIKRLSGPYGGLMFDRSLIDVIGLPDRRYVLYQDDTEFTRRIAGAGGRLLLVPAARIVDAEESWHGEGERGSAVRGFITSPSDFRVFYTFRNRTHLDHHRAPRSLALWLNSGVYFGMLAYHAVRTRRFGRLRLLMKAWQQGRRERLGESDRFPLP